MQEKKSMFFFTLNMTKGGSRFPSAVQERMTVQWLDSIPGCLKFGCGGIGFGGGGGGVVVGGGGGGDCGGEGWWCLWCLSSSSYAYT